MASQPKSPSAARLRKALEKHARPTPEAANIWQRERAKLESRAKQAEAQRDAALKHAEQLENQLAIATAIQSRKPAAPFHSPKRFKPSGRASAVLVLSDWHCEEEVELEKVNGLNEFNLHIASRRIEMTFDRALMLLESERTLAKIDHLVVAALGDFLTGHIHEDTKENTQLFPLAALRFACEHLERGLLKLQKHAGCMIDVVAKYGNHGRTTAKPRMAMAAENSYEYFAYLDLRSRLESPRMKWHVGKGYHSYLDIQGHSCRFHHGDWIKYAGGIGGITIPVNKAIGAWNMPPSPRAAYDFFGHFHQWLWHGGWICNGSLIGYSPYALSIKASPERPQQTLAIIDKDRGLTVAKPVFCEAGESAGSKEAMT